MGTHGHIGKDWSYLQVKRIKNHQVGNLSRKIPINTHQGETQVLLRPSTPLETEGIGEPEGYLSETGQTALNSLFAAKSNSQYKQHPSGIHV